MTYSTLRQNRRRWDIIQNTNYNAKAFLNETLLKKILCEIQFQWEIVKMWN